LLESSFIANIYPLEYSFIANIQIGAKKNIYPLEYGFIANIEIGAKTKKNQNFEVNTAIFDCSDFLDI
jgi:hypothetical protein